MIPYFEQPSLSLGPVTIYAFGAIVAAAVLLGLEIGRRRFRRLGVHPEASERFAWHVVVGGFAGAHLFSVLFYFPEQVRNDPLALLRFWENLSSFGGIVGGLVGMAVYFRRVRGTLSPRERWTYFDMVAFVFAIALMVGRVACTLAHDHPGTVTEFPLAISLETDAARAYISNVYAAAGRHAELPPAPVLETLAFHDLGWYEFVYLALIVVPVFLLVDRRRRPAGIFVALFAVLYMPARFALDFLRIADARYAGLTPAQWAAMFLLVVVVFAVHNHDETRGAPRGAGQ